MPGSTGAFLPKLDISYNDDPRVVENAATEEYTTHVTPNTWRSSRGSLMMAWFAMLSALLFLVLGGTAALAVGTRDAVIGMGIAVVVFSVIGYITTGYATRTGLTVASIARALFGSHGAAIAPALIAIQCLFYAALEASVVAVAFDVHFGILPLNLWYFIVVLVSVPLVLFGVHVWLDKFNGVLLPFYAIGIIGAVVWAGTQRGFVGDWWTFEPANMSISGPGWLFAFAVYLNAGTLLLFAWDYGRFGRFADITFNRVLTFGIGFYIPAIFVNGLAGIFLAHTIVTDSPLTSASAVLSLVALMGLSGVAFVVISQMRVNTVNCYVGSVNLEAVGSMVFNVHLPRWFWVIVVGVVAYLFMLMDILETLDSLLPYLGLTAVGLIALVVTHAIYDGGEGISEFRPLRVPKYNPVGLIALIVPTIVALIILLWAPTFGSTWSPIIMFVLSSGLYAGLRRIMMQGRRDAGDCSDPRSEVDDPWTARVRCHRCDLYYVAYEVDRDADEGYAAICLACASQKVTSQMLKIDMWSKNIN